MKRKVIAPNVVRGGVAIPIGGNKYLMKGKKHTNGGIDIGNDNKNGLEVEDDEVVQMNNKSVKVFSSVPFLNGNSPAKKVLGGEDPNKIFKQQESYKDRNNLNDDGSTNNKQSMRKFKVGGKKKLQTIENPFSQQKGFGVTANTTLDVPDVLEGTLNVNGMSGVKPTTTLQRIGQFANTAGTKIGEFVSNNPNETVDGVGLVGNVIGAVAGNRANKRMLDRLEYAPAPTARRAAKLKTNVNINPQLDTARESLANYERDIDANTASSRVALARKQRGRVATQGQITDIEGQKENMETQLVNQDRLNQQEVDNTNTSEYNSWVQGKANFNNAVLEKRSENSVGLIEGVNRGVQDLIGRGERRAASDQTIKAMLAGNPNVSPELLKAYGIKVPKTTKTKKRNNKLPD